MTGGTIGRLAASLEPQNARGVWVASLGWREWALDGSGLQARCPAATVSTALDVPAPGFETGTGSSRSEQEGRRVRFPLPEPPAQSGAVGGGEDADYA
jgi:hypothetical protein